MAYNHLMVRPLLFAVSILLLSACGSDETIEGGGTADAYVMGSAEEARRKATEPDIEDPNAPRTLGDLVQRSEAGEEFKSSASMDLLLVLSEDGTFTYYGPLKMGDDQALIRGRWTKEKAAIHLRLDEPRRSKKATVSHLVCPWRPGVIEYPLGRNAEHQVYYRLLDMRRLGELRGGIRVGGKRAGGD